MACFRKHPYTEDKTRAGDMLSEGKLAGDDLLLGERWEINARGCRCFICLWNLPSAHLYPTMTNTEWTTLPPRAPLYLCQALHNHTRQHLKSSPDGKKRGWKESRDGPQQVNGLWGRRTPVERTVQEECERMKRHGNKKDKQFDLAILPIYTGRRSFSPLSSPFLPSALCGTNPFWRDK